MIKTEFVHLVKPKNSLRSQCSFPNQIIELTAVTQKEEKNARACNQWYSFS